MLPFVAHLCRPSHAHFSCFLIFSLVPSLKAVCSELAEVVYKWFEIGIQLGIPYHKLKEFEEERESFAAALNYWLNGNVEDSPPSWKSIVAALKSDYVGKKGLAKRIEKKYAENEKYSDDGKS